ncbi:MAG: flagellar filament capping protein FliD [Bacillota bacterium]|uniref:Flagellar hook-associated protein 2 n=1 Tax=Thermanaerosceptrum fracticalcis TaxID=1712410 RepID=A0A7G6E495_THEFR|nr:flagellar filament capping protein FliD [Thermanaerosceptrum fracticalcis]QNB46899.1 flagellar filament capping protein FliD [Thermanaerosceptrum fracticalcis]
MVFRIGGLSSGLDIDKIVGDLMRAERTRLDKLEQNRQIILWRQENYHQVNKDFANFILDTKKEFGLTTTTSTGTLLNKSVSSLDWVKSTTVSDTTIAEVTARADAVKGTYTVNVKSLATNWSAASESNISVGDKGNLSTQFGLNNNDTINFTITNKDGKSVTINKTNLTNVTINDIVNEINNANLGITASYDSTIDRFFLQVNKTGAENTITITDNSTLSDGSTRFDFITGNTSLLKMKYIDNNGVSQTVLNGTYAGTNAVIDLGAATGIVQSSNQFTINGLGFNLKKVGGPITVDVATNVTSVYEKIEKFVEKYNELMDKIGTELAEERYRDYLPLTKEQKEAMSEKEIELWEEKAKSGLLKNDQIMERTLQSIRSGMYQEVSGVTGIYDQLTEIGITTEGYTSGSRGGKLVIDKDKLTKAIEDNVDSVLELLFKEPSEALKYKSESSMTSSEISQKRSESGLITRLYDNIITGMKDVINKAGTGDNSELYRSVSANILIDFVTIYGSISYLDKDVTELDGKIENMNDYLVTIEDRYWQKFTAMEKALSQMNAQSAWLAQQFSQR